MVTKLYYKIIDLHNLIAYTNRHPDLTPQIEKLMSIHRDNQPFIINQFLNEITPIGKIIILIARIALTKHVIAIARANATTNATYLISAVHIKSEYRGRHLCSKMLILLLDSIKDAREFELEVSIANMAAINCYQKVGFTIKSTNKEYHLMHYKQNGHYTHTSLL